MPKNSSNNNKGKSKKSFDRPLEKITDDPRFTHVHNDPRFKRPRRKDTKVTIDNRFSSMLKSSEFAEQRKNYYHWLIMICGNLFYFIISRGKDQNS